MVIARESRSVSSSVPIGRRTEMYLTSTVFHRYRSTKVRISRYRRKIRMLDARSLVLVDWRTFSILIGV